MLWRALVASLNASAAESIVPGDRAAGKQFFFGKGQCASCHMVYGEGSAIGPDLSNIAREMTVDEIREALLQPDAADRAGLRLGHGAPARWATRCADSRGAGPGSTLPCRT